ncbi:DUF7281 domain-containing protein [Agarivorans aestuarii]|uniref:DUF7281 domain-containing protein n=1 Tax=Agarivorans aestuarii TaxID=1563703 RepID=UPI001C7FC2BE|nr:hypothetical protein [Agarivorans aestuarii]
MRLNKVQCNLLQKAYHSNVASINLGKKGTISSNWKTIINALDLSDWVYQNSLNLDFAKREELYQLSKDILGLDLNLDLHSSDRKLASQKAGDDKLAGIKPNDNFLLSKQLHHGSAPSLLFYSSDQLATRCPIDSLNLSLLDAVIVVENLLAFDAIEQFKLPTLPSNTLVVYRGDAQHSPKAVKTLINKLPSSVMLIAFTDFDPAGFLIAINTGHQIHALMPKLSPELIKQASSAAKRADFIKQYKQTEALDKNNEQLGGWLKHWNENKKIATSISQELMLNQNAKLELVAL